MIRSTLIILAPLMLGICATADAQDPSPNPEPILREAWLDAVAAPATFEQHDMSADRVEAYLSKEGWSAELLANKLDRDVKYDLVKFTVAPGISTYTVTPTSGTALPVTLLPGPLTYNTSVFWRASNRMELTTALQEALESAVDAACQMKAKPSTLRINVDVGIAELEAVWESANVCAAN